ncbi:hypothetical protein APHAL10511_001556 [Amanita phalloides]|nr:hypothetical protein APHAL10511_001556 [Amanita phalloides]
MPLRGSSSSLAISSTSNTLKPYRSYDSNRIWNQSLPPTSGTPQTNSIIALVNRLKNKLPCNSGLLLDRVESDKPTQQAIETLVELSQDSIDVIAWTLADILHMLTKKQVDVTGLPTLEVLQSELFILKVLSAALASRWNVKAQSTSQAEDLSNSSNPKSRVKTAGYPVSNVEPAPLNEQCAKYILLVMVLFLRQTSNIDPPLMMANRSADVAFRDYECDWQGSVPSSELQEGSGDSVETQNTGTHIMLGLPIVNPHYEKTNISLTKSHIPLLHLISEYAGRIVFHVSASNWSLVLERLREKIRQEDENPDLLPIQLLAHSALNRQRLVQVLNELSSLLISMGKEAQKAVSVALRAAIWHWIDYFPAEFNDAIRTRGRTEGAPERVFDLIHSLNPTANEKVFWPTLTTLCCITSERITAEFVMNPYNGKPTRKEYRFGVEMLKHLGTLSRFSEISLTCAIDICRAAVYVSPGDEIPLRILAYDVVHEIKAAFSSATYRKMYSEHYDEIDIPFYAEALVALYRFLPPEDSLPLFLHCLRSEKSDAVKATAVRACLTLVQEANRISWQRSLDPLREAVVRRVKEIFFSGVLNRAELDEEGNRKLQETGPKAKQFIAPSPSDREMLLLGILALWRAEPQFFFSYIIPADKHFEPDKRFEIARLWDSNLDLSIKISTAKTYRTLTSVVFQMQPNHPNLENIVNLFKTILPVTLMSVANNLITWRSDSENQRMWISIAFQILELYARKCNSPYVTEIQNDPARLSAFGMVEIAFIISLTSVESNISQLSARGLRLIAYLERQPGFPRLDSPDMCHRLSIYDRLGDPKIMVIGRVGHQKRIRKLLRSITFPPDIHITIWSECFGRWRSLTESIYETFNDFASSQDGRRGSYTPNPLQETRFQWQNLTLFLAAILGNSTIEPPGYTKLVSSIPRFYLPDSIRMSDDQVPLIDGFLSDLTDLLVSPDAHIRDTAKDALGAELGPKLYAKVLKYLDEILRSIERTVYDEPDQNFLPKLDQFVSVLKLLLENNHAKTQESPKVDIGPTLYMLASLISRIPGNEASRTKAKFCTVSEIASDSQESLQLRKNTNMRHLILDIIMEWVKPTNEGDPTHIQCELNMACLRTAVKLLEQLHLQPSESESAGEDGGHVVSRLFNRYSGALLHGLNTYYNDDAANEDGLDGMSGHTNSRAIQKEAQTRELVITGLTHLVSANPDHGLRQCLSLAFDKDKRKRIIFAHVFTRVIKNGIKFDASGKPDVQLRRSSLCELVRGSNMVLALIICEVCPPAEVDIMISVLLNLFDNRASLVKLMAMMIDQEIERTDNDVNIFRGNSTCTRFLSAFAKIHGYSYLRSLIQPLIKSMLSMPPGCSYELDPSKSGDQDLEQNKKNVELIASSFLSIISASVPALPAMFREICAHIANRVVEHWPDSKFPALGSFIFLRFISPAVVTPEIVEVELPKDDNAIVIRRGLIVITKILQNLANNIFFGKEAYMVTLNKFLEENIANVTRFLSEIIKNAEPQDDNDQWLGNTADDTDDIVLHRFFVKHADKIGRELLSRSKPSQDGFVDPANGKRAWDELCTLLVDLKAPFDAPSPSTLKSDSHEGYKQLMARYARRDSQSVKNFFSETGVPLPQSAFFILHLSKIDVESLDIELLMYHIFETLSTYEDRQFELIVDCTSFTTAAEIPLQWVNYCVELIPSDIRICLIKTHILNPNYQAQKYLRRLYNVAAGASLCGEIKTYPTVDLLRQHVPDQALVPLAYTDSLEKEPRQSFSDVMMKIRYMRMPVNLDVGTSHLRITTVGKTPISPGLLCNSTEIIPLMDVSDVYNVSTGQDLNEFIIRRSRQALTMYFASSARDAVVKTIRSTKGRLKESQFRSSDRSPRNSNVPAVLLHTAFLSFDFEDEQLRAAAYDLLGAVCSYLNLEKNPIMSCSAGFVPGNYSAFVEQLSERLAEAIPVLTLDFLSEVAESMNTTGHIGTAERIHCLTYIRPWIKKLALFSNATSQLYERSGARLRDCIRTLAQLSISYPEISPLVHKYIWSEVAKLDNFIIDVVLDELVRMAVDGGIGSSRCEAVANILACLSSISVRAKIYSRMRKTLGKVSPRPSITLVEHTHWSEISTLLRLALAVSPQSRHLSHNQFHVPEVIHLTTLVAGVGQINVRKSVYGVIMNLLQSVYMSRSDDIPADELLQLMRECTTPAKLKLFGLFRDTPSSEYGTTDPMNDKDFLDTLEDLTLLLAEVMKLTSGSSGLLNVWRARWMSLITSTAFQLSPAIQIRSFIAMGTLAVNDVDDDMLYQLLVALRNALFKANETQTLPIVSMLRCLCKMVPALPEESRYLVQLFWLGVALLQSSHMSFFNEATRLIRVSLEKMDADGLFAVTPVHEVLLEGRKPLLDVTCQLDDMLKLSFETSLSFSLAAIIFKGLRYSGLRESAEAALRSLLGVTIRSGPVDHHNMNFSDALGYFLALLPLSTSSVSYRRLLNECRVEDVWLPQQEITDDEEDNRAPRVNLALLGVTSTAKALLVISFVGAMLTTAQGDDAETECLYALLCDTATKYPDIVALIYENLQDKIKDTFANSSNASIIKNVSTIFSIALQERSRSSLRESTSTLGGSSDDSWRKRQANALEELGMQGLANSFTFLPRDRGHATKMINWIPVLIERIVV